MRTLCNIASGEIAPAGIAPVSFKPETGLPRFLSNAAPVYRRTPCIAAPAQRRARVSPRPMYRRARATPRPRIAAPASRRARVSPRPAQRRAPRIATPAPRRARVSPHPRNAAPRAAKIYPTKTRLSAGYPLPDKNRFFFLSQATGRFRFDSAWCFLHSSHFPCRSHFFFLHGQLLSSI